MFFQFENDQMTETPVDSLREGLLTAGCIPAAELPDIAARFGFESATVDACLDADTSFRSAVEVYQDHTFTELRIMNRHEEEDDFIALYLRHNMILVVDIMDHDGSTREKYLSAIRRYPPEKTSCEKILAAFLDSLMTGDQSVLEKIENEMEQQEEALLNRDADKDFDTRLLKNKQMLSRRHIYYDQLLDVTEAVSENDNEIFHEDQLIFVDNVSKRIVRLQSDVDMLRNTVEHLQDAYSSWLDSQMNRTMKIFTVLTSVFFPLTIIVGWYGMNFTTMPELTWRYGYLFVIILSIVTVVLLALIGKRRKWF